MIIGGIYDTLLEYSSDTWSLDLYDDIYSISPPGEYLAIDAIAGTFIAGKLKVVDPNASIIKEAKALGICFGD